LKVNIGHWQIAACGLLVIAKDKIFEYSLKKGSNGFLWENIFLWKYCLPVASSQ